MFTMKKGIFGRTSVESDDFVRNVDQNIFMRDGALQFLNFRPDFHNFPAIFSTKLSHFLLG
jgi:hypothetical protein